MKKSQLRQLIREEIKKAYSVNETVSFEGEEYDILRRDGDWIYLRSIHDTMVGKKEIKVKEKDITINEDNLSNESPLIKKLNQELLRAEIDGVFGEEVYDADDAEFYGVKPGKYIKFTIEDVENSSILKVKRIAKANGLKFVHDAEDMLLFRESIVNEAKMSKEKIESLIWSLENEKDSWHPSSASKKKVMLDKLKKDLSKSINKEGTCGYDTDARTGKKFKTPGGL